MERCGGSASIGPACRLFTVLTKRHELFCGLALSRTTNVLDQGSRCGRWEFFARRGSGVRYRLMRTGPELLSNRLGTSDVEPSTRALSANQSVAASLLVVPVTDRRRRPQSDMSCRRPSPVERLRWSRLWRRPRRCWKWTAMGCRCHFRAISTPMIASVRSVIKPDEIDAEVHHARHHDYPNAGRRPPPSPEPAAFAVSARRRSACRFNPPPSPPRRQP
jgi:hypothetical protein